MKPQDVERVVEVLNRHYGRWFGKRFDPRDASALTGAKKAALEELATLKASLAP